MRGGGAVTLYVGTWAIPAIVTILIFLLAKSRFVNSDGAYGVGALCNAVILGAGMIVSLVVWLIWALLK